MRMFWARGANASVKAGFQVFDSPWCELPAVLLRPRGCLEHASFLESTKCFEDVVRGCLHTGYGRIGFVDASDAHSGLTTLPTIRSLL